MLDFSPAQINLVLALTALLAIAGVLAARWEPISLWLLSTWHSLPALGGISWLARRSTPGTASGNSQGEMAAMLTLCGSYARFIHVIDRGDYDNYMNYLRKAGDLGRRPFPPYLWFVIFSMVVVEATGLAYVLAGWTMPGASEALQRVAAAGIGFLIAIVLVFFTHWAGVEIHQWNQYRRDRAEWLVEGGKGSLFGADLSLNDPQNIDDHAPAYRQRATRGHGTKTCFLTIVTIIMVLAIGIGAAYVRGQVLEQELGHEVADRAKSAARFNLGADAAAGRRLQADQIAAEQEVQIKRRGGWGTLAVLAVIFFFLQLLGMFFGYRYSFNGRLGKDAYRALRADRFSSYSELMQYYDRIADIAQSRLERLQHLIEQRRSAAGAAAAGGPVRYAFRDYVMMRDAQRRSMPLGGPDPARARAAVAPAAQSEITLSAALNGSELATARAAEAPAGPADGATAPSKADEVHPPKPASPRSLRDELDAAEAAERQRVAARARARPRGKTGVHTQEAD